MESAKRMSDAASSEEIARLRALVPLHTLPDDAFDELLDAIVFESLAKGKILFQQGDTDHQHVYLLKGSVALLSGETVTDTIKAADETARFPVAHQLPREHTARAATKVRIARIDSRRLSDVLARTQTVDYQVADLDESGQDDWMTMLLQSSVLQQVPASNIQRVMMSVEQVEVEKDEDLVRQGDPGDFYYMITKGCAVVRRDNGDGKGALEVATLGPGDAFGEEALLSDNPRNSTVTMVQAGEVLRLSKDDFLDLINNPLLERLKMPAAQAKVDQGAVWLDLRGSEEYDESHLPNAINIPFESLRYQASSLASDRHYVLYADADGRATAGAFLLTERGFHVSVLQGGLDANQAEAPAEQPAMAVDDEVMQERIRRAEARAKELEERLQEAQRDQESIASEREQYLEQVREAVEKARLKLVETEAEKKEALDAQQKAYAEMERLTSTLEAAENERASLAGRMSEIEGLDKKLQERLTKAERELIGERERAESATTNFDDLSARLTEVIEQREQERSQHDRERGELKEEMTALQLDLEMAQSDLEALREDLDKRKSDNDALAALQGEIDALRAQNKKLEASQSEGKEQAAAELAEREKALEKAAADSRAQVEQLEQALKNARAEGEKAAEAMRNERDTALASLDELGVKHSDEVQRLSADAAQFGDQLHAVQTELSEALAVRDSVQSDMAALKAANDALQAQVAAGHGEANEALAASQARVAELEKALQDADAAANASTEALRQERDAALASLDEASAKHSDEIQKLSNEATQAGEQLGGVQRELGDALSARDGLQAKLNELQAANEALQQQIENGNGETDKALVASQERVAELEKALKAANAEAGETAEALCHERDVALASLDDLGVKHSDALHKLQRDSADMAEQLRTLQAERDQLQVQLDEARSSGKDAAAQQASRIAELETSLADAHSKHTELEAQQVESAQQSSAKIADQEKVIRAGEGKIDVLQKEVAKLKAVAESASEDLRAELTETKQLLEERNIALKSARQEQSEQSELIEALNTASAERDTLQLALSEREEEQARLVDLENQVSEALKVHDSELLEHEGLQAELRQQLDESQAQRQILQDEIERLQTVLEGAGEQGAADDHLRAELDKMRGELAARDSEVKQLRGVLEEYVDQIRAAQSGDEDASELAALRAELEMVREQAVRDVAHMREQLANAETQMRRLQQADGREAISHESMRQRIEELETSLGERQRELATAEDARHMLEDSLEDVNRQLDSVKRELDKSQVEADDAIASRREAESAREQLEEALVRLQEESEEAAKVVDFRDDRLKPMSRPIGMKSVASPGHLWPAIIGGALVIGALEGLSFFSGNGELFSKLLGL